MKNRVLAIALFCMSIAKASPENYRIAHVKYRCRIGNQFIVQDGTYETLLLQKAITNEEWNKKITEAIYAVRSKCKMAGGTDLSLLAVDGISVGSVDGIRIHTIE